MNDVKKTIFKNRARRGGGRETGWRVRVRSLILAVTLTVGLCAAAGCGKDDEAASGGKQTIKMMGWGSTYETGIFQSMIELFEKKYPEYDVSYDPIQSSNYMTVLSNAIANPREMPDVFYVADTEFIRLAYSTNIFEDLNPYIEKSKEISATICMRSR